MSLSLEQKQIRNEERNIGRRASRAVESFIHRKIASNLTIRDKGGEDEFGRPIKPILSATKVRHKMGSHRLLGLNLTSNKYGFIHHYGASERSEHTVLLSNNTSFVRRSHPLQLPAKGLFDNVYQDSGALSILEKGLSKTRTKAIIAKIKGVVVELNKQDNG